MNEKCYGKEAIIDLHNCETKTFNRTSLRNFFIQLCKKIKMKRCEMHFWDDYGVPKEEKQTEDHTKGTSAIQFILTSNITIHTLELTGKCYVNIFSCKDFDADMAMQFTKNWFKGEIVNSKVITRV